jgi:hypothetical protein
MSTLLAMPILFLGIVVLAAVIIGVLAVIAMARRQAAQDAPPPSEPSDFVGPVSSGGYSWRKPDESKEDFQKRVARENAEAAAAAKKE